MFQVLLLFTYLCLSNCEALNSIPTTYFVTYTASSENCSVCRELVTSRYADDTLPAGILSKGIVIDGENLTDFYVLMDDEFTCDAGNCTYTLEFEYDEGIPDDESEDLESVSMFNLDISSIIDSIVSSTSVNPYVGNGNTQVSTGVPGWGVALIVIVAVLITCMCCCCCWFFCLSASVSNGLD